VDLNEPDTAGGDDVGDESPEAGNAVLAPRPVGVAHGGRPRGNRGAWILLAALVVVGGVVVTKFLTSAIDYYCNVDEINVKDRCDDDRRLRVQGTVEQGSLRFANGVTSFRMSFNGTSLPVRYEGDPGGIFDECVPVVVHGTLNDGVFDGDRVEVKHSEDYEAENPDRVPDNSPSCP
jgi:cytochrome c-type biogenesis protein CcmE